MLVTLGAIIQLVIHAARRRQFRRAVHLVVDEAGLLFGGFEARALAELQKFQLSITLIAQSLGQFPREYQETILTNGDLQVFRCNSFEMAQQMADIFGTATLRTDKVLRTRLQSRQFHDGYDTEQVLNRGKRYDDRHQEIGTDERYASQAHARYRVEQEAIDEYASYGTQIQDMQKTLLNLQVGECVIRDRHGVRGPIYIPLPREPLPWPSLVRQRTEQKIERSIFEFGTPLCLKRFEFTPAPCDKPRRSSRRKASPPSTGNPSADGFRGWSD